MAELKLELHGKGNELSVYSLDAKGNLKAKLHGARVERGPGGITVSRALLQAYPTRNGHGTSLANAFDLGLALLHEETGERVRHEIETRIQKPHVMRNYEGRGYSYANKPSEFLQGTLEIDASNVREVKERALANGADAAAAERIKSALKHCLQTKRE